MAIIKILSRHTPSYASLIKYILQDGKNKEPEVFTHNLRSDTVEGVEEFIENETFRRNTRKDQVYLFHEIISFSGDEDATDLSRSVMRDLAEEYIRLRGHTGVMLGAVHREGVSHVHLHLVVSALEFRTGKSFRLSKNDLQELKVSFQEYHKNKYPELSHSFPEHGKGMPYMRDPQWQAKQREKRQMLKEQITDTIQQRFKESATRTDFLDSLRADGFHHYERNGLPSGIEHEGVKFRFSRLLEPGAVESLPQDETVEQTLKEIRDIRAARHMNDRERDEDR